MANLAARDFNMPFIDAAELLSRIKSPNNLAKKLREYPEETVERHDTAKRTEEDATVPIEIKKVISILGHSRTESQRKLGEAFKISDNAVSYYERGLKTNGTPNPELTPIVDDLRELNKSARTKAEFRALDNMMKALDLIPERIPNTRSIKTLASVAKTMAEISEKVSGRESDAEKTVHLHLYTPPMKNVKDYEVIDV